MTALDAGLPPPSRWSNKEPVVPILPSSDYIQRLRGLIHATETLRKQGYIVRQLSAEDLENKKRCQNCTRSLKVKGRKAPVRGKGQSQANLGDRSTSDTVSLPQNTRDATVPALRDMGNGAIGSSLAALPGVDNPPVRCKFHDGKVAYRMWTCCGQHPLAPGCRGEAEHTPRQYAHRELERLWRFYTTPNLIPSTSGQYCLAIAIDCEMGTAESGESELIRVTAIDYLSGNVLIDSLVYPDVKMAHYNTRYSGVTRQAMQAARRDRTCLFGRNNARNAICDFVGPDTIIVGHGASGDLASLRWIHPFIVDTLIVEMGSRIVPAKAELDDGSVEPVEADEVVAEKAGGLSLKALSLTYLNRVIQVKNIGHDSLEDAMATRDVLHFQINKAIQEESLVLGL